MIKSFSDEITEKIFNAERLTKKQRNTYGSLNFQKAYDRLKILNRATERNLLQLPHLHYHALRGTNRYSIDAESRRSPWRITFCWEDEEMTHVELVRIEDTH